MSTFPNSPRLLRAGLVSLDPRTGQVASTIVLQYNPDTLTRTLQPQTLSTGGQDRSEAVRLKGPPVETFKLDAEIDATDRLEFPDQNPLAVESGIFPDLAALERLVYPTSARLTAIDSLANSGTLEITPEEAPLTLFIWSQERVVPVRITDISVTEEAFDVRLNPMRAKVSLSLRVLSVVDLPTGHRGASLFMAYLQRKEALAASSPVRPLSAMGIQSLP